MQRAVAAIAIILFVAACTGSGSQTTETPELSEVYGCGHGFYLGASDQTAGLFLISQSGFDEPVPAGTHQLPSEAWVSELQFGTDLFANWCDDVLEPGEPEPVTEEVWQISGTLEILSLPATGECGPAAGMLSGAVARSEDGDEIVIGDLDLVNDSWGCFAG
ncbi:MAG TPA: hypothetical protein VEB69_03890 [Acidimicrobiia bacterium]|nr:hypothetical protein [Acidimicrobiia bacterium]